MEYIHAFREGTTGVIVLRRAEKRNALSPQVVKELREAFDEQASRGDVRTIVLRAEGPAFSAGADLEYLRALQEYGYEENIADSRALRDLYDQVYTCPKPVIAQVQGPAIAGGCGLITVCDFAIAVPDAQFGYPEVRIGFIPAIVMSYLIRRVGEGHARRLLLSGELIPAQEALAIGLVSHLVAPEQLSERVDAFARSLARTNSAEAMAATKRMLADIRDMRFSEALSHAVEMNVRARSSADCQRGISAFLRKEKFDW